MPGIVKPNIITITAGGVNPPVMKTAPGHEVTWTNTDSVPHTVTPFGLFVATGQSATKVFDVVGEYPFTIDNNPAFAGTVSVS